MPAPDAAGSTSAVDAAIPPGVPAGGRLEFLVSRNGSQLGTHNLAFRRVDDRLVVDIEARFTWKLGFVTLFRYVLRGQEVWRQGRLDSAAFKTDNNGARAHMTLQRGEEDLRVEGSATRPYRAPPDWLAATHWNRRQLEAGMINPQDGAALRYAVADMGTARAPGGATATAYRLSGENPLQLWYDSSGLWVGLRARAFDGSAVEYRPAP